MKHCIEMAMNVTLTAKILSAGHEKSLGQMKKELIELTSDSEIAQDILALSVNAFNQNNLKNNLKGIIQAQDYLKAMLLQLPNDGSKMSELVSIIDSIKKKLPAFLPAHLQKKPRKTENAILYFHLKASKFPAYPYVALQCHRALKHVHAVLFNDLTAGNITQAMAKSRLESIVIPFLHVVRFFPEPFEKDTLKLDSRKIREALRAGQNSNEVLYAAEEVCEAYTRDVLSAISGNFIYHRRGRKKEYEWGYQKLYGRKGLLEVVKENEVGVPVQLSTFVTFETHASIETAEGSYALEDGIVENETELSNDDIVRRIIAEQIRPEQYPSYYGHGVALNALNRLLDALLFRYENLDKMSDTQISIAAFFLLMLFYGFSPKKILNLKVYSSSSSPKNISRGDLYIDFQRSLLLYVCDSDLLADAFAESLTGKDDNNQYLKTSNLISLPLQTVEYVLREAHKRKKDRSPYLFGVATRAALLKEFKAAVRKALQDTPFAYITLQAISRTFWSCGINKYKIDPIVVELISGRASREFRAARFYTAISRSRIHADTFEYHKLFIQDLRRNARETGGSFKEDFFNLEAKSFEDGFTGSTYVPSLSLLKKALSEIRALLQMKSLERVEFHNLWTLYHIFAVMLTTAMRPIETERLRADDINVDNGCVSVRGKGNRLFNETRIIPASQVAMEAFVEAKKENAAFIRWLIETGRYSSADLEQQEEKEKAFFFSSEVGVLRPASSSNMRALIAKTPGLQFPFKLNSPRHLLRTFLFEKRVLYDLLNAFVGHQTGGKEFLSYYSSGRLDDLHRVTKEVEELARELCITIVKSKGKVNDM